MTRRAVALLLGYGVCFGAGIRLLSPAFHGRPLGDHPAIRGGLVVAAFTGAGAIEWARSR